MENKRTSNKEIIAYLSEKFPACFSTEGAAKPLKVGIFQDLAEKLADDETVSKTRLRQALRHYTSSWRYLKAVKLGSFRIDLEGNDAEEIDEAQAEYASKTLKESQEKFANKFPKDKAQKKNYKGNKVNEKTASTAERKKNSSKFKAVKTPTKGTAKVTTPLKAVESTTIKVGQSVKVKIGNAPMNATITEVADKDISVQLNSGMVVKTNIQNIYTE